MFLYDHPEWHCVGNILDRQLARRVEHDRQSTDMPKLILEAALGKPQSLYAGHGPGIILPGSECMS